MLNSQSQILEIVMAKLNIKVRAKGGCNHPQTPWIKPYVHR